MSVSKSLDFKSIFLPSSPRLVQWIGKSSVLVSQVGGSGPNFANEVLRSIYWPR